MVIVKKLETGAMRRFLAGRMGAVEDGWYYEKGDE
jgi:hypothetical protein